MLNIRGWARLSSIARFAQLLLLEEKHKMRFLYNYPSSDDSIRRCSSQVDDVFHHHFCHFLAPTTLPYQAYLGTIGTDDAIGSCKRLLRPWTSNVPSPGRR